MVHCHMRQWGKALEQGSYTLVTYRIWGVCYARGYGVCECQIFPFTTTNGGQWTRWKPNTRYGASRRATVTTNDAAHHIPTNSFDRRILYPLGSRIMTVHQIPNQEMTMKERRAPLGLSVWYSYDLQLIHFTTKYIARSA